MKKIIYLIMALIFVNLSGFETDMGKIRNYRDIALKNNLEIQMEKQKLEASKAKVYQSTSLFLPSVNFSSRVTNFNKEISIPISDDASIPIQPKKNTETKIEASQVLFSPAVFYSYLMQKSLTKSDDFGYKSKLADLEYNVLEAYYNCVKANELVKMRRTSQVLAQETYYVTQKLYEVEKVPETDVLRANVVLITGEQEVTEALNQLSLAKNYFNSLLNQDMNQDIELDSLSADYLQNLDIKSEANLSGDLDDHIKNALDNRAEIKQMYLGFRSTKYAKEIMLSDYLPSLVIAGDYGYSGNDFKYNEDEKSWSISGIVSWNLFSGFNSTAKAVEVNAQVKQMEKLYYNTKHLIELEVRNNYLQYKNSINQFDVSQKTYKASISNYKMVKKQYENELAPMITLTDAKNLLDASSANMIVSYFNVLLSQAKLDKSLGKAVIN